jgi:hypothetical protein
VKPGLTSRPWMTQPEPEAVCRLDARMFVGFVVLALLIGFLAGYVIGGAA